MASDYIMLWYVFYGVKNGGEKFRNQFPLTQLTELAYISVEYFGCYKMACYGE